MISWSRLTWICLLVGGLLVGFSAGAPADPTLAVSSSAFASNGPIPRKYSCQGDNVSPPLAWTGVPAQARSLALIMDDPDAPRGRWVHWVVYNLPAKTTQLTEDTKKEPIVVGGGQQGRNSFGKYGYGGPCPPPGTTHHYHFKLYALDNSIGFNSAQAPALEQAMKGHILAQAELVGTYQL